MSAFALRVLPRVGSIEIRSLFRRPGAAGPGGPLLRAALAVLWLAVACAPVDGPPAVGDPAPDVQAATLDGEAMALSDLRGQVVLVNLWATWCGPCRFETPFLQSLYEEYGERGFEIVGISVDDAGFEDVVREFTGEYGVTYTILHDPEMRSMDAFHAVGLPATYLVGRAGTIRLVRIGPVSEEDGEFFDALEAALAAGGPPG